MKSKLGLLVTALVLSACATNEYAKFPKPTAGEGVLIVPVGTVEATQASDKASAAFGLIGALVEAAVTAKSSEEKSKTLTSEIVQAKIEDYLGQQVLNNVNKCGVTGSVHKEVVVNTDKDWLARQESVLPQREKVKANYVIETGAIRLSVRDGLVIKSVCVGGVAKVFRTSDGMLVNKVPTSRFSQYVCPKNALEHFWDGDSEKFTELVTVTKSALDELAVNMASDICSKPE